MHVRAVDHGHPFGSLSSVAMTSGRSAKSNGPRKVARTPSPSNDELVELRRRSVPKIDYPESLPVSQRRDEIKRAIEQHQVVIVAGETGSGKTTQLPKICLELGLGVRAMIGHTQPRRLAARAVADRIADELGVELGDAVGYAVRFTDRVGDRTLVKLMTDGILLAELGRDRLLSAYDTIIVDEAHERSLNIDFILGYLQQLLPQRPDLKVIITSATIDTKRFSAHFGDAEVIEVSGRSFPVELRYRPIDVSIASPKHEPSKSRDQISAITDAVRELRHEEPGDILVFLSGEREIRDTAEALDGLAFADTEIVPLFARLSLDQQHRVFAPHSGRRIVLATNVAETSLTVPGIRYVIDPGMARISRFSTRLKVQRLPIEAISQASANQRSGRCGRVADGICIRLYSEDDFNSRPLFTDPEILRTNLASVILQMTSIGLGDIAAFPFLDRPDQRAIGDGIRLLQELGALESHSSDSQLRLSAIGRRLARLPIDPRFARMIVEADRNGCLREVLVITSALSIQDPRERPKEQTATADQFHARFADTTSDFLAYGKLWAYIAEQQRDLSSGKFRRRCRDEFLNYLRIREWQDVHSQLRRIADDLSMTMNDAPAKPDLVHQSLLAGLLSHIGHKHRDQREFLGARQARFAIFPGSTLAKHPPEWVMAAELVETTRLWGRTVARIRPEWVEELAGHLVKRSYSEPYWSSSKGAAMAHEKVTLFGLPIVEDRVVGYGAIDPEHARELFLRHGLVDGEWKSRHRFTNRNRELLTELGELEHRFRRTDLVVDLDALEQLYDERIPTHVVSGATFDAWWNQTKHDEPDLFTFTSDDLLREPTHDLREDDFPATWHQGDFEFGLSYSFEPGVMGDGVAVHIPIALLNQVRPIGFDWQVPGLRLELIQGLIRSLPKLLRRNLLPVPTVAQAVLDRGESLDEPILEVLERELSILGGETIARGDWNLEALSPHLRMVFIVVDERDEVLGHGIDLDQVKAGLAQEVQEALAGAGSGIEKAGLTRWNFGDLPRMIVAERGGHEVKGFPALADAGDHVDIRLYGSDPDQYEAMWAGTRRLLRLVVPLSTSDIERRLSSDVRLALSWAPTSSIAAVLDDCLQGAIDFLIEAGGGPVWKANEFEVLCSYVAEELPDVVLAVVREVASILATARVLRRRLETISSDVFQTTCSDIESQIDALVYDGFVAGVGRRRLPDIIRYLQAAKARLAKLPDSLVQDRIHAATMTRVYLAYQAYFDARPASEAPTHEALEIAWMIEELRVSLFAQSVGTPRPISEKRVMGAIAALRA